LLNKRPTRKILSFLAIGLALLSALTWTHGIVSVHANMATVAPSSITDLTGFQGLNQTQSGGHFPPDVQIGAGSNYLVEMVNTERAVYNKTGSLVSTQSLSSFFNTGNDFLSDPKVMFDSSASRWFASIIDIDNCSNIRRANVLLAVSSGSDPTGTWKVYNTISLGSGILPDQPIIGVSDDKVVASANIFSTSTCHPSTEPPFDGAQWWVFNKSDLVAGSSNPGFKSFPANATLAAVHPVQSLSSTTTEYMVSTGYGAVGTTANVTLLQVNGVPGVSNVTTSEVALHLATAIAAPGGAIEPCPNLPHGQQCVGNNGCLFGNGYCNFINTDDQRVQDAAWFHGRLWLSVNQNNGTSGVDDVRLIQIDTTTTPPKIRQDIEYTDGGYATFYPALQVDAKGDLDVIFGFCCLPAGSNFIGYPSLGIIGQAVNDPIGSLTPATTLVQGVKDNNATAGRYGDYFGAAVDPSNPNLVWVAGQYVLPTGVCPVTQLKTHSNCWSTWISEMQVNPVRSFTNLSTFTGVSVNSTCYLRVYSSSLGGACSVLATNSSTSQTLFSKTFILPSIGANVTKFILNIPINPYRLSSNIQATLTSPVTGQVTVTRSADIDGDGLVDSNDGNIINAHWNCQSGQSCYYGPADLNADGTINIQDLAIWAYWYGSMDYQ